MSAEIQPSITHICPCNIPRYMQHVYQTPAEYKYQGPRALEDVSSSIIPWCLTLQHLELSRVSCIDDQYCVSSLSFLSQFVTLKSLELNNVGPSLASRDLAGCTALQKLSLTLIQLMDGANTAYNDRLQIPASPALLELNCRNCSLLHLDLSGCTNLQKLDCFCNNISMLDLHHHTHLTEVRCARNSLRCLDIRSCTVLQVLVCDNNDNLSSLQLPNSISLRSLACTSTSMSSLDVSQFTTLQRLACGPGLETLEFSGCKALQHLSVEGLVVETLNLQAFSCLLLLQLGDYSCFGTLDLSGLSTLQTVTSSRKTRVAGFNITACTSLSGWYHDEDSCLTRLDVATCSAITHQPHVGYINADPGGMGTHVQGISCKDCKFLNVHCPSADASDHLQSVLADTLSKLGLSRHF